MRRYWLAFAVVVGVSFAVLGWVGVRVYREAPPLPDRVVTTDGREIVAVGEIALGQNVWQAMGGMQVGSVWGHGSYVAPDWSADWLHREAVFILDDWSRARRGDRYDSLAAPEQAALRAELTAELRENTFDAATRTLSISPSRARAYAANAAHYSDVFSNGRLEYAIPRGAQAGERELKRTERFLLLDSLGIDHAASG